MIVVPGTGLLTCCLKLRETTKNEIILVTGSNEILILNLDKWFWTAIVLDCTRVGTKYEEEEQDKDTLISRRSSPVGSKMRTWMPTETTATDTMPTGMGLEEREHFLILLSDYRSP